MDTILHQFETMGILGILRWSPFQGPALDLRKSQGMLHTVDGHPDGQSAGINLSTLVPHVDFALRSQGSFQLIPY